MHIAQPKSDNEAYKIAEARLNELQRSGINGRCALPGANIVADRKLKFKDIIGLQSSELITKST